MFLEIGAPVFDASIVAAIGCGWEIAADDIRAAAITPAAELAQARKARFIFQGLAAMHQFITGAAPKYFKNSDPDLNMSLQRAPQQTLSHLVAQDPFQEASLFRTIEPTRLYKGEDKKNKLKNRFI